MKEDNDRIQRKKGLLDRVLSSISFMVDEDTNTRDQRRSARLFCRHEVSYVDEYGSKGVAYLVDISKKGLQIETSSKIRKGVTLAVAAPEEESLDRTAPFMAKVRWCRRGEDRKFRVGLALPPGAEDDPHWLESLLHQLGYSEQEGQRREHIRAVGRIPGQLTPEGNEADRLEVEVQNLSMGGALIKSQQSLQRNSHFELQIGPLEDLPELKLSGTILRIVEKPDHLLYPSRFRLNGDRDEKVLREYILKLDGRD